MGILDAPGYSRAQINAGFTTRGPGEMVASYFLTSTEALRIAVSPDGSLFTDTGIVWSPASGSTLRDPSIAYNSALSLYQLAFTRPTTAGGGAFGTTSTFGLATSPDLGAWTEKTFVTMPGGVNRTWAPTWFTDTDGSFHIIVSLSSNGGTSFQTYELHPTASDLSSWSAPVQLSGLGANTIDCCIVRSDDGIYHAFVKNETTKYIEHATSATLTGAYTLIGTGDWAGWGNALEAPTLIRTATGGWRIYMDSYALTNSMSWSDGSSNLLTWTARRAVTLPMRHIGVFAATNNANLRGLIPDASRNIANTGDLVVHNQATGATLILQADPFTGSTVGKARIEIVSSSRGTSPGSIYYNAGNGPGLQQHNFAFDNNGSYTTGLVIAECSGGKAAVRFPAYATASRPTAAEAGAGGAIFDTTLNKVVTSNGTTWFDQTGTAA